MRPSGFVLVVLALGFSTAASPPATGVLRLHPQNPHYFEFKGQPTILITSAEHYGAVLNLDFNYVPYLDELQSKGLNNTRTWAGAYVEIPGAFGIEKNTLAPASGRFLCPWARSGTPGYPGGGNKFDLNAYDAAYFARLRDFVSKASARGIVVEINLFCTIYDDNLWNYNPMKSTNNVNGVGNVSREAALTMGNGGLLAVQEALARKIVAELNEYDNVYYEVCNEPYFAGVGYDWQLHMAQVVWDKESTLPNRHLISLNAQNGTAGAPQPPSTISIMNWHYADPPDVVANYYGWNIVIGENETGFDGSSDYEYRKEGWHFIVAGGGLYNNLDYSFTVAKPDGSDTQNAPGGGSPALRSQLRILKDFMYSFNFLAMASNNGVIQGGVPGGATARALVQNGEQYAIYLNGGSQANLAVSLPAGSYQADWVNTKTGAVVTENFSHGGGNRTISSPGYSEDIALRIKRTGAPPPPPPPPPTPSGTFYRAINLNGPALTIDGHGWEGSGAPNYSFTGSSFENQSVILSPATDAARAQMIRSSIWNSAGSNVTMSNVPNGTYHVYLYVWEDNFSTTYSISLEGQQVQAGYSSGAGGHWERLGPWPVNLTDGSINITCSAGDANLSGIEVWLQSGGGGGGGGANGILREYWTGLSGVAITDLTSNGAYPYSPSGSSVESSFEAPTDWAENYGTRMRGILTAPQSGSYVFWIASDDNGQLWLSTDDNPAHKTLVASVPEWTNSREWTKYPSQHSAAIPLVAGQRYYIEALQKEGTGGDNLAVGWTLPDATLERPIPGSRLTPTDPLDSDGDGVSDADEIAAGSDPINSADGGTGGGGGPGACGLVGLEALLVLLLRFRRRAT